MFFDDPVAVFMNIGRAVLPGGRLVIATWQPLGANDWLAVPGAALLSYGTLPDGQPGAPGMFAQAEPAALAAVADALAPHTTNDGVYLNAAIWITTGTARP